MPDRDHAEHILDIDLYPRKYAVVHQQQARSGGMHRYVAHIASRANDSAPT
jgi:hypothetical protein